MSIYGTKYQTFHWEKIKKLLINAGLTVLGKPEEPSILLQLLKNEAEIKSDCLILWYEEIRFELNNRYEFAFAYDFNEKVSLALELTDIFPAQTKRIIKLLKEIQKHAQQINIEAQWKRRCYTSLNEFFSDLRYTKDAENMTIATGRSITPQHIFVLAKIEALNRRVDKVFSDGDLETLAEITGENLDALKQNPFLVNRYKKTTERAQLIIAIDRVLRNREGKKPQLPTNKYNNLVNPDKVNTLLSELMSPDIVSTTRSNKSKNTEYDWLDTLAETVNNSKNDADDQLFSSIAKTTEDAFFLSPGNQNTHQSLNSEMDINRYCLAILDPICKLGLILKLDKHNDLISLISREDLAVLDGEKFNQTNLANKAGLNAYKYNQAVKQAAKDYLRCLIERHSKFKSLLQSKASQIETLFDIKLGEL